MHNPNLVVNCLTAGAFPEDCTPEAQELVFTAFLCMYGTIPSTSIWSDSSIAPGLRQLVASTLKVPCHSCISASEWWCEYRRWIELQKPS